MGSEDGSTAAGATLIVLGILTTAGRFYSRWFTKVGFWWDDWTILIAMLTGILPGALTVWATSVSDTGAAGASNLNPDYVFTPDDILYTKITFSTTFLYFFITCLTKISLLFLLHRIFAVSGAFRIQIYIIGGVVIAYWISATVADALNCIPLKYTWLNGNADPRYCINYNYFWLGTGIVESLTDVVILALPMGMVSKLHLERSKKIEVAGIFLLGGFVLFSGVAKVVLSYLPHSREPNFAQGDVWTTVHLYTGIICANLPASRPLVNRIARLTSSSRTRLLSFSRRYLSTGNSSWSRTENHDTMPRTVTGDKSRAYTRAADVEEGRVDYELARYGRVGQPADDSAKLVQPPPGMYLGTK